jgi:hypothetical protein
LSEFILGNNGITENSLPIEKLITWSVQGLTTKYIQSGYDIGQAFRRAVSEVMIEANKVDSAGEQH